MLSGGNGFISVRSKNEIGGLTLISFWSINDKKDEKEFFILDVPV